MDQPIRSIEEAEAILAKGWNRKHCIFRGQAQPEPLIPRIGRGREMDVISRLENNIISRLKEEYRKAYQSERPHSDFRVDPDELRDWHWHVLAQHHGLPTRLLDWSKDLNVAMFFAVAQTRSSGENDSEGALYVLQDPAAVIEAKSGWHGIKNVRRFTACGHKKFDFLRVKRQQGQVTYQPDPKKDLFEQLGNDERQKWERFLIPGSSKPTIRCALRDMGITRSWLFPGLDGLCEEICIELGL